MPARTTQYRDPGDCGDGQRCARNDHGGRPGKRGVWHHDAESHSVLLFLATPQPEHDEVSGRAARESDQRHRCRRAVCQQFACDYAGETGRDDRTLGTGFGPTTPTVPAGTLATQNSQLSTTPTATVGGIQAAVPFAGIPAGYCELYQVDITIPPSTPNGDQAVVLTVNGRLRSPV